MGKAFKEKKDNYVMTVTTLNISVPKFRLISKPLDHLVCYRRSAFGGTVRGFRHFALPPK